MLELTTVAKLNPLEPEIYPTKSHKFPLLLTEKNGVSIKGSVSIPRRSVKISASPAEISFSDRYACIMFF